MDLGSGQVLRFGLARQMARPVLNDMRASFRFSLNSQQGQLSGDAGDPKLKPFRADAVDLSYEKYFGNKGYVSAAVFYKQLNTYVIKSLAAFDYAALVVPGVTPLPPGGSTIGTIVRPTNGKGGEVEGLELTASLPFSSLTPVLEGFGVQTSYSLTNSAVELPVSGLDTSNITVFNIPLPGLSKQVYQATLYYERYGFSARVGQRYRSNFIGDITDYKGDNQLVFVKAERIMDLQVGYEFMHGPVKGLSLLFQANNLNNAPYVEYKDDPSNPTKNVKYGKTYLFGVNYRM
jgi:iron complex outermembrane receptor protein